MAENIDQVLRDIYFNPENPVAYGQAKGLYKAVKHLGIKEKEVKKWLSGQDLYTLHRKAIRKFKRPRVIVSSKDQQWDGDTMNMVYYKKENNQYAYVLVLIDIFTRYVWTVALKTLKAVEMEKALKSVFKKVKPLKLRTDKGTEFCNKIIKKYLKTINIMHFTTAGEIKANFSERSIRTIKTRLTRYLQLNNTKKWIDILELTTLAYNNSKHRTIKMTPTEARKANRVTLWKNQYDHKDPVQKKRLVKSKSVYVFEVNDRVRLSTEKSPFERAYYEKWTQQIYTVIARETNQGIGMYTIKAWDNEVIEGKFYKEELQKIVVPENKSFVIDKVLRKRRVRKKDGFDVSWYGWPTRYNSWIPKKDLKDVVRLER